MSDLKYTYMYSSNGDLTHIKDANKNQYYYPYFDKETVFIVRDGLVNRKHYSLKNNSGGGFLGNNVGNGESFDHYNSKMEVVFNKGYYDTIFKKFISFDEVVPEKKQGNKIPDLSCFINGVLVLAIEIYSTNEKTFEDIEELKKIKIPVTEININNGNETEHLILPAVLEANRQEYERLLKNYTWFKKEVGRDREVNEEAIEQRIRIEDSGTTRDIEGIEYRISEIREEISSQQNEIEGFADKYHPEYKTLQSEIERLEGEIENTERGVNKARSGSAKFEGKISEITELSGGEDMFTERIKKTESEFESIKEEFRKRKYELTGNINWQKNRSGQFKTIIERGY